ncbi:hypothetical protein [Acinetobacter lwoffii]|uniref:hypothetical protein n=1 Tax=Acinetobacter lwoffii TaxID=28090 RepID=UPI00168D5695|nr:hypothetical protein [Acinetobacter lwoffii]
MRKINPLALSTIGGLFIFTVVYILFWVLFLCLDSPNAAKEALNILGNYFGGIATLWAAFIAAYLFNDWRVQEKTVFIRNVAYETSNLVLTLFNIMQGYIGEKENLLNQIMPIQSQITLKLAILNKQIKDNQMHLVNDNFRGFMFDYIEAINLYQHDRQALKGQVSILIKSYGGELSYLAELANLDNVFEKLKTTRT